MNRKERKQARVAHLKLQNLFNKEKVTTCKIANNLHDELWEKQNMSFNSHKQVMGIYQFMKVD